MDDAVDRRARLKGIRAAAEQPEEAAVTEAAAAIPVVKFRNYKLRDETVQHEKVRLRTGSLCVSFCLSSSEP